MNRPRPIAVIIIAALYILVGIGGFAAHFKDLLATPREGIVIELTELIALLCGVFMLRGSNLARWGALAWMAFHVFLSISHTRAELAIHCGFLAVIAWFLLQGEGARYFRRAQD